MDRRTYFEITAAIVAAGLIWYFATPKPEPVDVWRPAITAPQLTATPKVVIKTERVVVYIDSAKKKLDLPPDIQANRAISVAASSRVPPDLHAQTVTTLFDATSGEFSTIIRREPYPWLATEQTGEIRLDYGFKNGGTKVARLSVTERLVQIKALHLGVSAAVDSSGSAFVGAGVGWGW